MTGGTDLYAIFSESVRGAKIGRSDNPKARLASLRTSHPSGIELVCTAKNFGRIEMKIHLLLQERHIAGEWFSLLRNECHNLFNALNSGRLSMLVDLLERAPNSGAATLAESPEVRRYIALILSGLSEEGDGEFLFDSKWAYICQNPCTPEPAPVSEYIAPPETNGPVDPVVSSVMSRIAIGRWERATAADRIQQGRMLHEGRQKSLSQEQRSSIARKAAAASAKVRSAKARAKKK